MTASDGGLHATTDPLADSIDWISLNNGYLTSQFYSVAILSTRGLAQPMLIGGLQDNGTWRSEGGDVDSWSEVSGSDGGYTAVSSDGRRFFTSKQLGVLYAIEIDDRGRQTSFRRIDPLNERNLLFISPYAVDPNNPTTVYYPNLNKLLRNRNILAIPALNDTASSVGWDTLANNVGDGIPFRNYITAIACTDQNPSHRLWLGLRFSRVFRFDNALQEDFTITEVTDSSFPDSAYIYCIATHPSDGRHAVVVFSNYGIPSLFSTTDGGETWTDVSGNLEENRDGSGDGPSTRWLKIIKAGGEIRYLLGTSAGLFSTVVLDGANTVWMREGAESIGFSVVTQVDTHTEAELVVAATHGMGIFSGRYVLSGVGDEEGTTQSLLVTPNPLHNNATITYTIPSGKTRQNSIKIYDLAGRVIKAIELPSHAPGTHTASIDASDLPRGTYIVRMAANNQPVATTRIMVE